MVGDVQDLDPWIAEATRVLAPGGHLVYSDFHPSWATEQWKRTFQGADGRQFELNYFPHTIDEHLKRLEEASLEIRTIREPRIAARSSPVVAVFHAIKTAPPTLRVPDRARMNGQSSVQRPSGLHSEPEKTHVALTPSSKR
jgi:malonyl-CoA O-methyltransferase